MAQAECDRNPAPQPRTQTVIAQEAEQVSEASRRGPG